MTSNFSIKAKAIDWRNSAIQALGEREFSVRLLQFRVEMQELDELTHAARGANLAFEMDLALEEIIALLAEEHSIVRKQLALWWLVMSRKQIGDLPWSWLESKVSGYIE